jgi:hypothetical protein
MNTSKSAIPTFGRVFAVQAVAAIAVTFLTSSTAHADGYSNPDQARAVCEKRGKAGTPAELKKCCADVILVADMKQQRKLEAQCAAPKSAEKAQAGASASKP